MALYHSVKAVAVEEENASADYFQHSALYNLT